jgi:hypothetical protein
LKERSSIGLFAGEDSDGTLRVEADANDPLCVDCAAEVVARAVEVPKAPIVGLGPVRRAGEAKEHPGGHHCDTLNTHASLFSLANLRATPDSDASRKTRADVRDVVVYVIRDDGIAAHTRGL